MNILVTGAGGFIGKNLVAWLARDPSHLVLRFERNNTLDDLTQSLTSADWVFHLAGVNRPQSVEEFRISNVDLTVQICERLTWLGRSIPLVFASSIQAELDNPFGLSKRAAEAVLTDYARASGAYVAIYRLKNVFGKWCRPNYNSVVATFCYNIARELPISISDPYKEVDFIHIDDVIRYFVQELQTPKPNGIFYRDVEPSYQIALGSLAELIHSFREMRRTLLVPNLNNEFIHKLYGTYLSYLEQDHFDYTLDKRCDTRGCLAEFVKSPTFGQIFASRTAPGVTRGNHYHHTKAEKFLVVDGEAIIRFRHILGGNVIEYRVRGEDFRVLDIPPGYTHSIENVGQGELITLFWASEIFDLARPDTNALPVLT